MHVSDLGAAFAALFDSGVEGAVNVASGLETSVRELVTIIATHCSALERVHFGALPDQAGQPPRLIADVRRLRDEVGWKPPVSLQQRVEEACAGWKAS
jgi:nucleoside-diphosphate-sugar epimerase